MKKYSLLIMLLLFFSVPYQIESKDKTSKNLNQILQPTSLIKSNSEVRGVVVVDDSHQNDYSDGNNLGLMQDDLSTQGYIVKLVSEYPTLSEALDVANYFVMSAPYAEITASEITDFVNWFDTSSANLLIASRGDFETSFQIGSFNDLMSGLTATIRAQDDNVYTTDPIQYNPWYVATSTFNETYSSIFNGVNNLNFFSPSSILDTDTSDILVFGDPMAYQTNQNGNPADMIYDDTENDVGGDAIPLAVLENVLLGNHADRIVATGTTMWSNFDYADTNNDDIAFFNNILNFFHDETITEVGEIIINLPDTDNPIAKVIYPRANALLQGTVTIKVGGNDLFGIESYKIYVNGELRSSTSTYLWDTTQEADGDYIIKAEVTDPSGKIGTSEVNYKIDQSFAPSLNQNSKVMTYNIKQSGLLPPWLDVMKEENADIVMLVETGDFDNNNNQILNEVVEELNAYFIDEIEYKGYTLQNIDQTWNGTTILSRFDIVNSEMISSLTRDDGSGLTAPLPFLHSEILINNALVHVIGAHLTCCGGIENQAARYEEQESILNFMDDLGDEPIIYLGDMNAESKNDDPNSDLGNDPIDMVVDSTHPSASTIHNFADVHATLNPGEKVNSYLGSQLGRIDFIFVNQWLSGVISDSTTGDTASANIGSDHAPVDVIIDFSIIGSEDNKNDSSDKSPLNFYLMGLIAIPIIAIVRRKLSKKY